MDTTLVVVDRLDDWCTSNGFEAIDFRKYLKDYPKINEPRTSVINLCDTSRYLSQGYYCSLLAESRGHRVIPSVKTINLIQNAAPELPASQIGLTRKEHALLEDRAQLDDGFMIYMGKAESPSLHSIAWKIFQHYRAPLLEARFCASKNLFSLRSPALTELSTAQQCDFLATLGESATSRWGRGSSAREYRWEMCILVNPDEKVPPSNKGAIKRFVRAADKLGIQASVMSAEQILDINRFDALFIRETTAIDHHSYRFACEAESNNIIVIDDPTSILRCCNKVFLHDAFSYQNVPSLRTRIVDNTETAQLDDLENLLGYPMVVKMPESSFSQGVFRVEDRPSLTARLNQLLEDSALVIVQEYMPTDFDWRIGVLNGRPLYACRYYMAAGHWQIYNHSSKRNFSGGFESLPTFEVPRPVIDVALSACRVVGDGFYGVDIKENDGRAFVIEVNDNPSIEHKIEDASIGEELYMQVMSEFLRRLELRGR